MEYKSLYNISKISGGKRLPKGKMLIKTKNAHPYIKVKDMATYITNLNENFEYVPDDVFNSIKKYTTRSGDILLSIVGTIGNLTIVGESLDKASLTENCVKIETNQEVLSKYLYYYLTSRDGQQKIKNGIVGSTQPKLPLYNIESITVPIPDRTKQQHIVDTIGSVDDLIEKNYQTISAIKEYGGMLFSGINTDDLLSFTEIVNLEKGIEIGSANYIEKQTPGILPYIRVGTLLNNSYDTFCIDNNYKKCDYDDILVAFDGAPGRNSVGLTGIYSSGIYKISCADSLKGYVYFYINSPMCQKTIKEHSQGTTILHAGKSIKLLQIPNPSKIITLNIFSILYNELIAIYKKQKQLNETKDILLRKYFE